MVVQRHENKRNLIAAPHAELLRIFAEFHHIVSKKFFRIMNTHFNTMEAKTVLTKFYPRSYWSIMRYMMNLNTIMALIDLSSKMIIFMERKQKFLYILEQKGILSLNFDLYKKLQHSRMKNGSLILLFFKTFTNFRRIAVSLLLWGLQVQKYIFTSQNKQRKIKKNTFCLIKRKINTRKTLRNVFFLIKKKETNKIQPNQKNTNKPPKNK